MAPIVLLLMTLLLAGPGHPTPETPRGSEVGGSTSLREEPESFRVLVSEGCVTSGSKQEGPELELLAGSPLVLTHRISLVPSIGAVCRCQGEMGRLLGRLEELEREVSALRVSCTAGGGGCCSSKESKGAGCLVKPEPESSVCPGHCSDQGRCVGGACVCFHGFSGPDCSRTTCPADCNDRGRCVDGRCQCDPGYTGPDCSWSGCPGNCNHRGRCVDGQCVCDSEFSGPDCSGKSCPGNCNHRGRCVDGRCVCNPEFSGPDCSEKSCPGNCSARGRCVDGQCVCDSKFSGRDCSEKSCPGNCNHRGRCVDGQCVCDPEFSGPDCSEKSCPSNCNHRGSCVDGQCVCDPEFSGPDCSEKSCPGNCNHRGRCVDGQCVCDPEFSGPDCSEKSCPGNCNHRGRCVDGRCVCDPKFSGPDCSVAGCRVACGRHGRCEAGRCVCDAGFTGSSCTSKSCPGNCSNRGRCVKGRCLCQRAFSGPDCSQCVDGMTGPNCDQALSAVTSLIADDITESTVMLLWTQPAIQYRTYDITFTSMKDSDQQIKTQVEGGVVRFVQTGLAPGQEYTATITGQTSGQTGASSSIKFNTSTSSPTNLRVIKTSTSSAVVQWEPAQGEVDRYRLTVSPSDGAGESQEIALPPERDSAHIEHLEAGRLYDITLRAESSAGQSLAAAIEVVPGETVPSSSLVNVTVPIAPTTPQGKGDRSLNPASSVVASTRSKQNTSSTTMTSIKPLGNFQNRLKTKPRVVLTRRLNGTRAGPGWTRAESSPLKRSPVEVKNEPTILRPRPGRPVGGEATPEFNSGRSDSGEDQSDKRPARLFHVTNPSGTDGQITPEGTTAAPRTNVVPEVSLMTRGNQTRSGKHSELSPPQGRPPNNEKKCFNKVTVTHFRLPQQEAGKGRGRGDVVGVECGTSGGDGTAGGEGTPGGDGTPKADGTPRADGIPGGEGTPRGDGTPGGEGSPRGDGTPKADGTPGGEGTPRAEGTTGGEGSPIGDGTPKADGTPGGEGSRGDGTPKADGTPGGDGTPRAEGTTGGEGSPRGDGTPRADGTPGGQGTPRGDGAPEGGGTTEGLESPGVGAATAMKDHSTDQLHQLIKDTFNSMNIETFSVHLSKPPDFSLNADSVRDQILAGLRPISSPASSSPSSSSSSSLRIIYSSLLENSPPRSSSSSPSPAISSLPSSPSSKLPTSTKKSTASPLHSSSKKIASDDGKEVSLDSVSDGELSTDDVSVREEKQLHTLLRQSSFQRRPNLAPFRNRTRFHPRTALGSNSNPGKDSSPAHTSLSSTLEDPSAPRRTLNRETNGAGTGKMFAKQNQTSWRAGGFPRRYPSRHVNTNSPTFQNRTHPLLRWPKLPSQHMTPETQASNILPPSMAISSPSGNPDVNGSEPGTTEDGGRSNTDGPTMAELNKDPGEMGGTALRRPPSSTRYTRRPVAKIGLLQNRTRPNVKAAGLVRRPVPSRRPSGDKDVTTDQIQIKQSRVWDRFSKISGQSEKQDNVHSSAPKTTTAETGNQGPTGESRDYSQTVQRYPAEPGRTMIPGSQNDPLSQSGSTISLDRLLPDEAGDAIRDSDSDGDIHTESLNHVGSTRTAGTTPPPGSLRGSETLGHSALPPTTAPRKVEGGTAVEGSPTQRRNQNMVSQQGKKGQQKHGSKAGHSGTNGGPHSMHKSDVPSTGPQEESLQEPLGYVAVRNRTSDGFALVWEAPEGKYSSFVVTRSEEDANAVEEAEEEQPEEATRHQGFGEENSVPEIGFMHSPPAQRPSLKGSEALFSRVLPGSGRSFLFEKLAPQTPFTVTLLGQGTGVLSRLHKLVISTGPSPPSSLVFSQVSEDSVTLTWTAPPVPVSSFKVTYTHTLEGEPISVVVGSEESSLSLSQLSPGSTYEVSVISVLGLDESDPIQDSVTTLPDPPTDLRLLNVTDSEALLLWRPAKAAVDEYSIVYGTGTGSDLRVTVSGNTAEQRLGGLAGSTVYSVTVTGLLGDARSATATANFTTSAGGEGEEEAGPQDFLASEVTPRTTLLSWKPPAATAVDLYTLTYQAEGAEPEEVTLDPTTTNHKLRRLRPGSSYTATLQGERDGRPTSRLHAHFTTGVLRFPYPSDCSQELLNGFVESGEAEVFPGGGRGVPLPVYCDMETDGGGWTVFQRRMDGSVDFYRGWKDYVRGFGDLGGEFWLGLDNLHNLTSGTPMSLRVDLRADDEAVYARYSTFQVAKKNYRLTVAGYSGTAGDSMTYHNQRLFSARDRDPTPFIMRCAVSYRGGWWYKNCHHANLNGLYGAGRLHQGVIWTAWKGKDFSIPWTEMKMRPSAFIPPSH